MDRYVKKIFLVLVVFFVGFSTVNAAANYTVSLSSANVSKGKKVTLYVKGTNIAGGFSVVSSDSTVCSISSSSVWVDNDTQTISVNALRTGSCNIKVTPISVSDYNGNDVSLSAKTLTLNVNNGSNSSGSSSNNNSSTVKKSDDATLKSLSIEGINITPEFKSDVLEYKALAEANVEKIKIIASPNNGKASVVGAGENDVSAGVNKLEIVVTAEDGTTKTYVINVEVKEYAPINVKIGNKSYTVIRKENDLPEVDLFEKCKVEIGDDEVAGYYNDKLNIYLIGLKDDKGNVSLYVYDTKKENYIEYKWITVGGVTLYLKDASSKLDNFKRYSTMIKNTKLDIYRLNKKDKIGLVYGTNVVTGNTGWYVYDKEEETLARYYDREVELYRNKISNYKNYLMLFMGCVSGIIIVMVIISLVKGKKNTRKIKR